MNREFREKIVITLCASSLFSLTLFLFGPSYLFFTNISEFPYLFSNVWYLFVAISLLCTLLISAVFMILKPSIHQKAVSLLFAFGFLLWFQGNILVLDYGLLNGKEIIWNDYKVYGIVNTVVWVVILTIAFIKRAFVYKIIKKITIVLILVQIISLSIASFQAPEQPTWKNYSINEESKYTFSAKKNVIILVLDTFQTDIFQELINENPEYQDAFKGFTYFRNAVGGFPTTYVSIPLILTGHYYDNSVPMQEFLKNTYSSSSIPHVLKQNGYRVDLFTDRRLIYCSEDVASNIVKSKGIFFRKNDLFYIYNVTLFRYMPHFIKKYFYTVNGVMVDNHPSRKADLDFADKIVSASNATSEKYTFKFYHLWGTHPPFYLNEKLEHEALEFNRNGYKIQAKAILEITKRFLTTLKNIGVYDNSMIFIVGDHGSGAAGSFGLNVQVSGFSEDNKKATKIRSYTIGSGIPLILVKPIAAKGDLKISDAPVSHSDISKTIFSELGIKHEYIGQSMFSVKELDIRERRFLEYQWRNEYVKDAYLSPMEEYIVTGFSWLKKSWRPTHRKYTFEGVFNTQPPIYQYGAKIQFGQGGSAEHYQGEGWSQPEKGFTWTDGKNVSLIIPVSQPQSTHTLKAVLNPFISNNVDKQRVKVYINGEELGVWNIQSAGEYKIEIPKNVIKNSVLEISFELPDAASPSELKISNDSRTLGIAVQSITIW